MLLIDLKIYNKKWLVYIGILKDFIELIFYQDQKLINIEVTQC